MLYGKVCNHEETIKICVTVRLEYMLENILILGSIINKIGRVCMTSYNLCISASILKFETRGCKSCNC